MSEIESLKYGQDWRKIIFFPESTIFDLSSSGGSNPISFTSNENHCFVDDEEVYIVAGHQTDEEGLFEIVGIHPVTSTGSDTFTIPYDASNCTKSFEGIAFKPRDLSDSSFIGYLFESETRYISGDKISGLSGGRTLTVDEALTAPVLGNLEIPGILQGVKVLGVTEILPKQTEESDPYSGKDSNNGKSYSLVIDTDLGSDITSQDWTISYFIDSASSSNVAKTIEVSGEDSQGYKEFSVQWDSSLTGTYFFRLFEQIGDKANTLLFSGNIQWQ